MVFRSFFRASPSPFAPSTLLMPIDEPRCTGFTKSGHFSCALCKSLQILLLSVYQSCLVNQISGTVGTPSARKTCFVNTLSIATLEANKSHPTHGTPAIRRSPIKLPSSPYVPCIAGKTKSIFFSLNDQFLTNSFQNPLCQRIFKPLFKEMLTGLNFFNFSSKLSSAESRKKFISFIFGSEYQLPSLAI